METAQTLRRRIKTVGELHAIVRTMKALAAVSGRQYEAILKSLEDYARPVEMGLRVTLRGRVLEQVNRAKKPGPLAAVIFGSDVGLCGRFNEELVAFSLEQLHGRSGAAGLNILAVGARIEARLSELGQPVSAILPTPSSPAGIAAAVGQILTTLDLWQKQAIGQVLLFYSQSGTPKLFPLLPVDLKQFDRLMEEPWPSRVLPTFSLDAERLLAALIRQHLFASVYRAIVESLTAENQLRLRAMQAAEKNIEEKMDELVCEFRTQRQDAIDAELLDIGAGFEAVRGH